MADVRSTVAEVSDVHDLNMSLESVTLGALTVAEVSDVHDRNIIDELVATGAETFALVSDVHDWNMVDNEIALDSSSMSTVTRFGVLWNNLLAVVRSPTFLSFADTIVCCKLLPKFPILVTPDRFESMTSSV